MAASHMSDKFNRATDLGFSLLGQARFIDATSAFRNAMLIDPSQAIGIYGAGFSELRRSNSQSAMRLFMRAALASREATPANVISEIHLALGHCRKLNGHFMTGRQSFRRASIADPTNAGIYFNHSNCFDDSSSIRPRPRLAKWAVMAAPGSADHWNNLGLCLVNENAREANTTLYRRASILNPEHLHVWNNLGILHKHKDHLREGVRSFQRARCIDPSNEGAVLNLGRNELLLGNFEDGWRHLEEPWRNKGLQPRDGAFNLPIWDGSHLAGGQLLLWSEEKIGEEMLFSTMLEDTKKQAGLVTLLCNPRIATLLKTAMPGIEVMGWTDGTAPPVDPGSYSACYPLEYVGRFVRRSFADFPPARALLKERPSITGQVEQRNSDPVKKPTVGLHWRSINPFVGDYKSIPLSSWGPILTVSDINFVSLQYGAVANEIEEVANTFTNGPTIPDGIDQMKDMESFTKLVAGLDLIISISSTSAHVSGSLGRPTWVLLPRGPGLNWFWFENQENSPWYPRSKLYRQARIGEWRGVLEKVGQDLLIWRDQFKNNPSISTH